MLPSATISIHALLAESDVETRAAAFAGSVFLSTLSLRRATWAAGSQQAGAAISIHALLAESDTSCPAIVPSSINFYPRSPCGERLAAVVIGLDSLVISIHALLAESDELPDPHNAQRNKFLSTLSLRRATYVPGSAGAPLGYFYPRSPCGERPNASENERYKMIISIHALLAESDPFFHDALGVHRLFLSTLSLRRATAYRRGCRKVTKNFYPRSPCGERQIVSLLPRAGSRISIHALLAESDVDFQFFGYTVHNFYPRSPCGERLKALCDDMLDGMISIHALLAESDFVQSMSPKYLTISIHALLAESDWRGCCRRGTLHISIHALLAESDSVSKIQSRLRL